MCFIFFYLYGRNSFISRMEYLGGGIRKLLDFFFLVLALYFNFFDVLLFGFIILFYFVGLFISCLFLFFDF